MLIVARAWLFALKLFRAGEMDFSKPFPKVFNGSKVYIHAANARVICFDDDFANEARSLASA